MNHLTTAPEFLIGAQGALARVERATHELRRANPILLVDADHLYYVLAAESLSPEHLNSLNKLDSDSWHLVITDQRARRLGVDVEPELASYQVRFDQPATIEQIGLVIDPVFPLNHEIAQTQPLKGCQFKAGHDNDNLAILLTKHAELLPSAIVIELAAGHEPAADLVRINVADIREGIAEQSHSLKIISRARVPLEDAEEVEVVSFRPDSGAIEHLAIIVGKPDLTKPVMIRLHSECFTGDLLGSLRCDCGSQLRGAISLMANTDGGILLYLAQEGRGIGLVNKLRAYQLQDSGLDTVDANLDLGFDEDERDYQPAVEMLKHLDVRQVRVLTNNPRKVSALTKLGVNVLERVAHVFPANRHNRGYLMTKGTRGGHLFDLAQFQSES